MELQLLEQTSAGLALGCILVILPIWLIAARLEKKFDQT